MQRAIIASAFDLFEQACEPRTTVHTPYRWSADEGWRERYLKVRDQDLANLQRLGMERRSMRSDLKAEGRVRRDD